MVIGLSGIKMIIVIISVGLYYQQVAQDPCGSDCPIYEAWMICQTVQESMHGGKAGVADTSKVVQVIWSKRLVAPKKEVWPHR